MKDFKQFLNEARENVRFPVTDRNKKEIRDQIDNQIRLKGKSKPVSVPHSKMKAGQLYVRPDHERRSYSEPVHKNHSDHGVGLRDSKGFVHISDGHNRIHSDIRKGKKSSLIYVYNEKE